MKKIKCKKCGKKNSPSNCVYKENTKEYFCYECISLKVEERLKLLKPQI